MDFNYWKRKYAEQWKDANKREEIVKNIIEEETGLEIEYYGIGAGEDTFISGSAEHNNSVKGEPDLHVINTSIFIEVTGSFSKNTKDGDPLWFRPDKLRYAYDHRKETDEFLVNNFLYADKWYVIHLVDEFWDDIKSKYDTTDYKNVKPIINGGQEEYIAINGNNPFIKDFNSLLDYLHKIRRELEEFEKDAIRRMRDSINMTQKQFAIYFNIPIATVQDWEQNRRKPPFYVISMIDKIINLQNLKNS